MSTLTYLIDGIIPQHQVSILAGDSGVGKTTWIFQALLAMQREEPVFGHPTLPHPAVGYVASDRTWDEYQTQADLIGVDLSQLKIRTLIDDLSISLDDYKNHPMDVLEGMIDSLLPVDLMVVDPLIHFFGQNSCSYNYMAAALIQVNRWAKAKHITILATHHATKGRSDYEFTRTQDRISGSAALQGFSSTQLFLQAPVKGGPACHQLHICPHTAAPSILCMTFAGGTFTPWTAESEDEGMLTKVLNAIPDDTNLIIPHNFLLSAFPDTPRATLDRYLNSLLEQGHITRPKRGCYRRAETH